MGCCIQAKKGKKNEGQAGIESKQADIKVKSSEKQADILVKHSGKKDNDHKEDKRQKMLLAAEEREKKQKMHGMSAQGYKDYEEKVKRQKNAPPKDNYEPLNWNS